MDEVDLARNVTLCQPSNLTFADHMHRFIALDRPFGARKGPEAQTRVDPPFDCTVILLHDVVEIGNHAAATAPAECMIPFQFVDRSGIGGLPSTLITRGRGQFGFASALRKNARAADKSRVSER